MANFLFSKRSYSAILIFTIFWDFTQFFFFFFFLGMQCQKVQRSTIDRKTMKFCEIFLKSNLTSLRYLMMNFTLKIIPKNNDFHFMSAKNAIFRCFRFVPLHYFRDFSVSRKTCHSSIEALHVTYYTVNMADCSSPFKRSVITTYHHSLSTVYQMHWYQIGQ